MSVSPVATVSVGQNPFSLDTHHVGIDLYGRPKSGPLFYEIAPVNGTAAEGEEEADGGHGGHGAISRTDSDSFKDIFGRLTYTLANQRHTVGVLGYFGKTALPDGIITDDEHNESDEDTEHEDAGGDHAAPALVSEDDHADGDHVETDPNDTFRILGVDAELNLGRFNLRGAFLIGKHDNPLGNGESVSYQGVMGNIIYPVKRNLLAAVRYD